MQESIYFYERSSTVAGKLLAWVSTQKWYFTWKVNNGDIALFWEDCWFEGLPLISKFPRLFQLSTMKNHVVRIWVDLWSCYDHDSEVFWSRKLRQQELEEVKNLDYIISTIKLNSEEDCLLQTHNGKKFTSKEGLEAWRKNESKERWQWNFIWKLQIPPNIKIFL